MYISDRKSPKVFRLSDIKWEITIDNNTIIK